MELSSSDILLLMTDSLRLWLYFSFGFLPSIFFTARFWIQWFQSERAKRSFVTPLFWQLSFIGNFLLMVHYTIQVQYPFALIQMISLVIAARNLNLMQNRHPIWPLKRVFGALFALITLLTLIFFLTAADESWMRTPLKKIETGLLLKGIGILGVMLFASRFWLQWWQAERAGRSELGPAFFWISLTGSILSLLYFTKIHDWVSVSQYGVGTIPYLRNLILLTKRQQKASSR